MRSLALALILAAAPPDAPPDRIEDYSGAVTGSGIQSGRITVHVASTELVTGAFTGRMDGHAFNVALHGKMNNDQLTLTAQGGTASARDLRIAVEPIPSGYRGTIDGELHGKPVHATFEAKRTNQRPPEKTNGH